MTGRPGGRCCPSTWTRYFRSRSGLGVLVGLALVLLGPVVVQGGTLYVDSQASPGGDGTQAEPFATLHEATAVASAGDEVQVAAGVYDETVTLTVGTQTRRALLILPAGVAIRGAGVDQTILRGPPGVTPLFGITASGVDATSTVSDLTVDGACVQGVNLRGASPTLARLAIRNDVTGGSSLAMDVREQSAPHVVDCVLDGGHASLFIEFESGGLYERCILSRRQNETLAITNSDPTLLDCTIQGAGRDTIVFNQGGTPVLRDCTIGRGDRWTVRVFGFPPGSTIDASQNRWFTGDAAILAANILDAVDDPGLGAQVVVEPLLPPLATHSSSFGGVKARFDR